MPLWRCGLNWFRVGFAAVLWLSVPEARAETTTIDLIPGEAQSPIRFETESTNVTRMASGEMVRGEVFLAHPFGRIRLVGSSLFFEYAPGTERVHRVRGEAYVPSPFPEGYVSIERPAMAQFGMDQGRNLALTGVPLQPERFYLFFRFDAGLSMEIGASDDPEDTKAFRLEVPAGATAVLVLDPLDPFYYYAGALITPRRNGADTGNVNTQPESGGESRNDAFEQFGEGKSVQGLIPFRPTTTYGIADRAVGFNGHEIIAGNFTIPKIPATASGYRIQARDPIRIGDPGFMQIQLSPVTRIGINGDIRFSLRFLKLAKLGKIADFNFPLGSATAAVQLSPTVTQTYFSGILKPDTTWIPDIVPIRPEAQVRVYGLITDRNQDFRFFADSRYAVDASGLGQLSGLPFRDVFETTGSVSLTPDGFRVSGRTAGDLGPLGAAERTIEHFTSFDDPANSYMQITGRMRIVTMSADGLGHLSRDGLRIEGSVTGTGFPVRVTALMSSTPAGPFVEGSLSVPPRVQSAMTWRISEEAANARNLVAARMKELEDATKNFEVEVSLRGMRTVIPTICDTIIREIDGGIDREFDDRWPSLLPGESLARREASDQAEPHRRRLRNLKAAVQSSDSDTARAGLKSALLEVLNNQHIRIRIAVIGTVMDRDYLNAANESRLRTALAAVDALPEASSRRIRAEQLWRQTPKQEILLSVDEAIRSSADAVPRITAIGFRQPLFGSPLQLFADVAFRGRSYRLTLPWDPSNPGAFADAIGSAFATSLSEGTVVPPPPGAVDSAPVIAAEGVRSGASGEPLVAAGSWLTVYGANLSRSTRTWRTDEIRNGQLPRSLDGVAVAFGNRQAAVQYVSPSQVNVLVPTTVPEGMLPLRVTAPGGSTELQVRVQRRAPAFFTFSGADGVRYASATFTDFRYAGPEQPGFSLARPGDILVLWGTGFGPSNPPAPDGAVVGAAPPLEEVPAITVGGVPVEVLGAALSPGFAGLCQIAIRVPALAPGSHAVVATSGGIESPWNVFLAIGRE